MANIPTSDTFDTLLAYQKTLLEAIATVYEVIIGIYSPVDLSHWVKSEPSNFPRIAILNKEYESSGFISQCTINGSYHTEISGYTINSTPDRVDGTDMKNLSHLGTAIRKQIYTMLTISPLPCTGFRLVNGNYSMKLFYQEQDQYLNTVVCSFSYNVDTNITGD